MRDRRQDPRYEGFRRVGVQWFDDETVHNAYLMDFSAGGAGIAIFDVAVEDRFFRLILGPSHADWLTMEIVDKRRWDYGVWMHARFCKFDAPTEVRVLRALETWIDKWAVA